MGPGLVPALAVHKQESSGDVSLSTGTGALVPTVAYYGKRSADPQLLVHPYAYGAYPYVVPAVKPLTLKTEVTATNLPVPVAVGGYKAVAGDNGELKGAVHEVPALFGAPALNTQENEGTSLTVGTSAVVTHTVGEPIVKEHTVKVPVGHYIGKREAEADPYLLYGGLGYGYGGYGLGYGHGLAGYGYGYGLGYGYPYYG